MPLVRRTRATLRRAEFGFLGVWVRTMVHPPRFWGAPFGCRMGRCFLEFKVNCKAGALLLLFFVLRPLRTNWLIVGTWPSEKTRLFQTWRVNEATATTRTGASLQRTSIRYSVHGRLHTVYSYSASADRDFIMRK